MHPCHMVCSGGATVEGAASLFRPEAIGSSHLGSIPKEAVYVFMFSFLFVGFDAAV